VQQLFAQVPDESLVLREHQNIGLRAYSVFDGTEEAVSEFVVEDGRDRELEASLRDAGLDPMQQLDWYTADIP
jgi:hypothetical protein